MERISYKLYKLKHKNLLVVFSFENGDFLFYDDISADVLYSYLIGDINSLNKHLEDNEIQIDEWENFRQDFFYQCTQKKSLETNTSYKTGENEESKIYEEIYESGYLYSFHLDVTKDCNFRCKHCYHTFEGYEKADLPFSTIEHLFTALSQIGVFKIVLSGGEPFFRNDIIEILKLGKKCNFVFEIYTNGYCLDEKLMQELKKLPISLLSFSYYGGEKATQRITGNQFSYQRLLRAIDLCEKYNMFYELKYIILKDNIQDISVSRDFCKDKNIPLTFEMCITPKIDGDCENLTEKISDEEYKKIILQNEDIMLYDKVNMDNDSTLECNAGRYGLYCDYSGNIYPCVSWRRELGNVFDGIEKIWENIVNKKNFIERFKCSSYPSFNQYSFCQYCYQICPGLSYLENASDKDCYNSGCNIAKIIEHLHKISKESQYGKDTY